MTQKRAYEMARRASEKSDFYKCKTGCVAIYRGSLLAEGWNSEKTSPIQAKYNFRRGFDGHKYKSSLHAEMTVIKKIQHLDIDFSQVEIYVWRGKDISRLARPCKSCETALRELGIRKIFYTGNNSLIKEIYS